MRVWWLLLLLLLFTSCTTYNFYITSDRLDLYETDRSTTPGGALPANEPILVSGKRKKRNRITYMTGYTAWATLDKCTFMGGKKEYEMYVASHSSNAANGGGNSGGSTSGNAGTSSGSGGTVQVKGYTRKDGTYVAPHTRSAPRKH